MPWYQVPVRQASDLPLTSFRPNVTVGTLSLAVRLPLLGRARDLHPLDYAHVGRTSSRQHPVVDAACYLFYCSSIIRIFQNVFFLRQIFKYAVE